MPDRPLDLYAELSSRKIADVLNADTRPTRRESLLEIIVLATGIQGGNGELRFPRAQLDQAAMARQAGRRLQAHFDPVTYEYVITLTGSAAAGQQQIEGT
jgi:hypothetical protein